MKKLNDSDVLNNQSTSAKKDIDVIDLREVVVLLWRKRRYIIINSIIFLIIGIFIAFTSPVKYTAKSVIMPQSGRQSSTGNLGNLASMVGVNFGSTAMAEGTISTSLYPQILNSLPFAQEMMNTEIIVENSHGEKITLFDYYTNKEYRNPDILGLVKKYTIGLPRTISTKLRSPKKRENTRSPLIESVPDSANIVKITNQERSVYNAIKGSIQYEYKDGVINLGFTFPEALAAAQVCEQLYVSLEKYVINYKTEKVEENLAFVEQSFSEARKDFLQKQANLAAFQDANRSIVTATGRKTETRLRSEYDIAFTIYNELARQLEQAKLSVKEERPVLTIIDPVTVPLVKTSPRRPFIIIGFLFFGLILSVAWIFLQPLIRDIRSEIKSE